MLEELQKVKDETGADISEDIQAVYDSGFSFYQGKVLIVYAFRPLYTDPHAPTQLQPIQYAPPCYL